MHSSPTTLIQDVLTRSSSRYIENTFIEMPTDWQRREPGMVFFDADGTILESDGDQWKTLIRELPNAAQERVFGRIKLLSHSTEKFDQQYLTAGTLYEYALANWTIARMQEEAKRIKLRAGVVELIGQLKTNGYQVAIISHGSDVVLKSVLKDSGLDFVKVFANPVHDEEKEIIAPLIEGFIPPYQEVVGSADLPPEYRAFVELMGVVPATKGEWVEKLANEHDLRLKKNISLGDSIGDLSMLAKTRALGGVNILHIHTDKKDVLSVNEQVIEQYIPEAHFFAVNTHDKSFEPTIGLLKTIM